MNIIAGRCGNKIVAPGEYRGSTDHSLFETWFSGALLEEIPQGSVVILDNATFHRKKTLASLAQNVGCEVIFLPPYSPDLNPVENLWANLKTFIRNYGSDFNLVYVGSNPIASTGLIVLYRNGIPAFSYTSIIS